MFRFNFKFEKIIISCYLRDDKVIRVSLGKFFLLSTSTFLLAPYFLLGFFWFNSTSAIKMNHITNKTDTVSSKLSAVVKLKPELKKSVPVKANSSTSLEINKNISLVPKAPIKIQYLDNYKLSEINFSTTQNGNLEVGFNLSKKKLDNFTLTGQIYIEAYDGKDNIISVSEKSFFKFSIARKSQFTISKPKSSVARIKVYIMDNNRADSAKLFTTLNVPLKLIY